MQASNIFCACMQTFSHKPFNGLPDMVPGHLSDEKFEKNDIFYLRLFIRGTARIVYFIICRARSAALPPRPRRNLRDIDYPRWVQRAVEVESGKAFPVRAVSRRNRSVRFEGLHRISGTFFYTDYFPLETIPHGERKRLFRFFRRLPAFYAVKSAFVEFEKFQRPPPNARDFLLQYAKELSNVLKQPTKFVEYC